MNKSLIPPELTHSFSDDSNSALMTAWPLGPHQRFLVDLSETSVPSTFSRRIMPETPDEKIDSPTSAPAKNKKTEKTSNTDNQGTPKKKTDSKKAKQLPPPSISKKPPSEKTDTKEPKKEPPIPDPKPSVSPTKKKRAPEKINPSPVVTAPKKPVTNTKPVKKDIQNRDSDFDNSSPVSNQTRPNIAPETSNSGSFETPPEPPQNGTASLPPEPEHETEIPSTEIPVITTESPIDTSDTEDETKIGEVEINTEFANAHTPDTPIAYFEPPEYDLLTEEPVYDFIDKQANTDDANGMFSTIGNFFSNLFGSAFSNKTIEEADVSAYLPVVFPTSQNPTTKTDPVESFRAGYISQRDIESALGRDEWTMCCAATFVYAIQTKYPGLGRDVILEAAEKAADTELEDESGNCVDDDGYIPSIWQYSQALSKNLELDDYVDISGQFSSVESARAAGAMMMKVELSGTIDQEQQEHHILQIGRSKIDPYSDSGIDKILDPDSKKVENVMALDWYTLP